jgi:uncharacterized membrane protein YedE/YeeE
MKNLKYLLVGIIFGILFVKAEIFSWFRIQEMFLMQSFFMYGIIGTAIFVGTISVLIIKKFKIKTFSGDPVTFEDKESNKGQIYGGLIFGIGWAITGACPGPLYAQLSNGFLVISVVFLSAVLGTWCYGYCKDKLPH